MSLRVSNLRVAYGGTAVIAGLSLPPVPAGELTVLLGPNAAGKSTFFKAIAGLVDSESDTLSLQGESLLSLSKPQRFREVCYMPQQFSNAAALSVFEVVLLARKQLQGWRVSADDIRSVEAQLEQVGILSLADRQIYELSGGQQQLVSLCQSLVRPARVMMLDEPTSALDLKRQLQVLQLVREQTRQRQLVTIVALHDLSLAARFADHVIVMQQGQVKSFGQTEQVFTSGVIEETYGVALQLLRCQQGSLVVSASLQAP